MSSDNFGELRRAAGRQLGYGRDPDSWSANQVTDIWDNLKSGLNQFYYPPRSLDGSPSYQWSFMRPVGTLTMVSGESEYVLPDNFVSIVGGLYYVSSDLASTSIAIVNEARILHLRQRHAFDVSSNNPQFAAITPVISDGLATQKYKLLFYPTPDQAYSVQFTYIARQDVEKSDLAVPLGGSEHFETIRASVLAACELFLDDARGEHYQNFQERLQASIDLDRKMSSPQSLGYNGDGSSPEARFVRSTRLTSYEKFPL